VTLMLMTLVLPGSAQIVAGRKQVGRIAMRIWFVTVVLTVLFVIFALLDRRTAVRADAARARLGLPTGRRVADR
jgi:hypothetical protein